MTTGGMKQPTTDSPVTETTSSESELSTPTTSSGIVKKVVANFTVTEVDSESALSDALSQQAESKEIFEYNLPKPSDLSVLIGVTHEEAAAKIVYHDYKYGRPVTNNIKVVVREAQEGREISETDIGLVNRSPGLYNGQYSAGFRKFEKGDAVTKLCNMMQKQPVQPLENTNDETPAASITVGKTKP